MWICRRLRAGLAFIAPAFVWTAPCGAANVSTTAFAEAVPNRDQQDGALVALAEASSAYNTAFARASVTQVLPSDPFSLHAFATGQNLTDNSLFSQADAQAIATVSDHLTLIVPPDPNAEELFLGSMYATVRVHGSLTSKGSHPYQTSGASVGVTLNETIPYTLPDGSKGFLNPQVRYELNDSADPQSPIGSGTQVGDGEFDDPIGIRASLDTRVSGLSSWYLTLSLGAGVYAGGPNLTETADANDTLSFVNFTFLDQQGNVIPGLEVVGDSGVAYPVVPEPAALAMLGAAVPLILRRHPRGCMRKKGRADPS